MTFIKWNLQFNSLPWYCLPFKILRIFISTFLDLNNRPWISFSFLPAKCSPLTDNNSSPLLNCLLVFDFASFPDSTSKIRMWSLLSFFTYIDKKKYKAFTLRRKYEMKIVFLIWLEFLLITACISQIWKTLLQISQGVREY